MGEPTVLPRPSLTRTKVLREAYGWLKFCGRTELRLFRVLALNFEALSVSYEGGEGDLSLPLAKVSRLSVGSDYRHEKALKALRDAARPLAYMGDTMGAAGLTLEFTRPALARYQNVMYAG